MELRIGPPASPALQRQMTDANTVWVRYNGTYIIPAGQFITRFQFGAVSSAGGNPTVGNFLDGIAFSTPVVACPTNVTALNTNPPPTTALTVLATSLGINNTIAAITAPPSNGTANISTTRTAINYTPNPGFFGTDSVGFTVVDAYNKTAATAAIISVQPPPPPPPPSPPRPPPVR